MEELSHTSTLEDIYQYVHPPLPLIHKHQYTDDTPVSHQPLL